MIYHSIIAKFQHCTVPTLQKIFQGLFFTENPFITGFIIIFIPFTIYSIRNTIYDFHWSTDKFKFLHFHFIYSI